VNTEPVDTAFTATSEAAEDAASDAIDAFPAATIPFVISQSELTKIDGKARAWWTEERLQKLTAGKRLLIVPSKHARFLFVTGLLNRDGTLSPAQTRKFLQVNHMVTLVQPAFEGLARAMPGKTLSVLDAGCGNSYLSLALAFLSAEGGFAPLEILGVDSNPKVIAQSRGRAETLGLSDCMRFEASALEAVSLPERIHVVIGLHACDTATDAAIAIGLKVKADVLAIAPCCQAELAKHFKTMSGAQAKSALAVLIHSPNLRRDGAATFTDSLRLALVRALGYEVTATEFIPSAHTPKNRLLLATRRGNYDAGAFEEFVSLRTVLGSPSLALERAVAPLLAERGFTV